MPEDPRHRNETFDQSSIGAYLTSYADRLREALDTVDTSALQQALEIVEAAAIDGRHIYTLGNGGSAAIADHLCCDWTKGTHHENHPSLKTHSMTANGALYSAIANDFGFEQVFSTQVEFFGEAGDVLLAISSSGNSPNVLAAVTAAHTRKMKTIGFSGFTGGRLNMEAQVSLYVAANNYGIVEDAHQTLMHVIAQYIASKRDQR